MNPSRSGEGDTKIVVITDETPEYVYKLLTEYLSNADIRFKFPQQDWRILRGCRILEHKRD